MCGIVGYLGKKPVVSLIIESLKHLEYRGYDSAGVAYDSGDGLFELYKASGKLLNLERLIPPEVLSANGNRLHTGIGHIRWATHGSPNDINAHPHLSCDGQIALVHNGIIENFSGIKTELLAHGHAFKSETDTEVLVHLLEDLSKEVGDFRQALFQMVKQIDGAYAIGLIHQQYPNHLFAVRNKAPLVVGIGSEEGEYFFASDAVALAPFTNKIVYIKDLEIVVLSPKGLEVYNFEGQSIEPTVETLSTTFLTVDKKGYKHFMLKEIHEQPDVLRSSLTDRLHGAQAPITLFEPAMRMPKAQDISRIYIVGCGTSYHAGLVGKYFMESLVKVPVEVEAAGEFRYRDPILDPSTLVIAISQSGETADTLQAIRQSKEFDVSTLVMTNRMDSTMAREADAVLNLRAGVEVSVCATKSFLAQVSLLYLLGLYLAEDKHSIPTETLEGFKAELMKMPALLESLLAETDVYHALAKKYGNARDAIFIARGINYPVALEGALKLKEISYIHAEGYSGSELKHGPIAILDHTTPVIALLTAGRVFDKMISNCQEAKARDAQVIAITNEPMTGAVADVFEDIIHIPKCSEMLSPLLTAIPLQLLAYAMAEYLGKDVDQPRNLAKSVTVE